MTRQQRSATDIAAAKLWVAKIQRELPEFKGAAMVAAQLTDACNSLQKAVEELHG